MECDTVVAVFLCSDSFLRCYPREMGGGLAFEPGRTTLGTAPVFAFGLPLLKKFCAVFAFVGCLVPAG